MENIQNKIEAVLFTTGRFLTIDELSELVGIGSSGLVKEAVAKLTEDYKNKNSSLEILEENNKFKLNIKKEYLYLTTKLLNETEFDRPVQETLALIAFKQPVLQSGIIDMRGNTAYEHVKKLRELEFITSEKSGRTRLLKTTQKFYDYFDVVGTQLKEKLDIVGSNFHDDKAGGNGEAGGDGEQDKSNEQNKTKDEINIQKEINVERKKRTQKIKKIKEEVKQDISEIVDNKLNNFNENEELENKEVDAKNEE